MLRQALVEAEKGNEQSVPEHHTREEPEEATESDALLQGTQVPDYAEAAKKPEEDDSDSEYAEDEEYMVRSWHDSDRILEETPNMLEKAWAAMKSCFMLVVDVENLWDSPTMISTPEDSRRKHFVVLFWFFVLAASYATERTTFKCLVDWTGPFRLVTVEVVAFTHALAVGIGMFISAVSRKDFSIQPLGIPIVDVGLMALLDTVHMLLVFLTGYHVAPTLTVILVQFTLPLTALITQFVHPDGCANRCCGSSTEPANSPEEIPNTNSEGRARPGCGGLAMVHILGSVIITLAVLLALCPALYSILDPEFFVYADTIPLQTAYNTLLFVSSCIPAAASQLYKEHVFLQHKQPVQADYLNFLLSILQLIFASIISPLVYPLLGLASSDHWVGDYPSKDYSKNFVEGMKCYMGTLDDQRAEEGYPDNAQCDFILTLLFLHVFSIIAIGIAVDKIVNAGATKVMFRGVSAGIIVSVIGLYVYDLTIPDFTYGVAIDSLNLVCVLLIVVGSEVYHRVSLQDATFETVYPEVENIFDEE